MRVLNVGGGVNRQLPPHYAGWDQTLLDIDPACKPDICCNARDMAIESEFGAVFCSHNLEHFPAHEVPRVLGNFRRALVAGGMVEIVVPNLLHLFNDLVNRGLDLSDTYYRVPGGRVTYHDVLYGWNVAMSQGNEFYAHRCGFTPISLGEALQAAGFKDIHTADTGHNLTARGIA